MYIVTFTNGKKMLYDDIIVHRTNEFYENEIVNYLFTFHKMDGCGDLRSYVDNIISIPIKDLKKLNISDSSIESVYNQADKIFLNISSIEYVYGIFETYSEKADKYDGGETTYYIAGENTKSVKDYVDHHVRIFGRRIDYIHLECLTNTEMKYASVIYHGGWGGDLVEQRMSCILDL